MLNENHPESTTSTIPSLLTRNSQTKHETEYPLPSVYQLFVVCTTYPENNCIVFCNIATNTDHPLQIKKNKQSCIQMVIRNIAKIFPFVLYTIYDISYIHPGLLCVM